MENCFVKVKTKQKNLILGSIYRPPNSNTQEFLSLFQQTFHQLVNRKKEVIIGLDHNLDLLKHHLHKFTQSFLEFIIDSSYLPCISRPTRVTVSNATLLDNILVSQNLFVKQVSSVIVDDLSDHFPCLTIIKGCMPIYNEVNDVLKRKLSEKNISIINDNLCKVDWHSMLLGKNTNECMTLVHSKIIAEMDIVAPEHPCSVSTIKGISVAWMTPGIAKMLIQSA